MLPLKTVHHVGTTSFPKECCNNECNKQEEKDNHVFTLSFILNGFLCSPL